MLKNITALCHRAYTCSCLIKPASPVLPGHFMQSVKRTLKVSACLNVMDKDLKANKKKAIEESQRSKLAQHDDGEDPVKLEGLTEAGITIPTLETHSLLVDGVRYDELPIAHIQSTPNNTMMIITDYKGDKRYASRSCGTEGFKNVKKSTSVAAQTTGFSIGTIARRRHNLKNVRVVVKGVGAGRHAAMKGLQMAGLNIVSITDNTPIFFGGLRPRKAKRL